MRNTSMKKTATAVSTATDMSRSPAAPTAAAAAGRLAAAVVAERHGTSLSGESAGAGGRERCRSREKSPKSTRPG